MIDELGPEFECIAIDLPGFGQARDASDWSVAGMAQHVRAAITARGAARWLLVGHSMGGKIASVVAAQALAGEPGLFGLAGIVLLAASPPSPEPMEEDRRRKMISWAAHGPLDDAAARTFVDANTGCALAPEDDRLVIEDLKRASPQAWVAWLERGSREDWSTHVGTLDIPALVMVGGSDGDLGEDGQRATNMRVYPRAELMVEEGVGHLLPVERPKQVATRIARFWQHKAGMGPAIPAPFVALMASDRVSRRTRAALAVRAIADDPDYAPRVLSPKQLQTLRTLADQVLPQDERSIDLAARVDAQLASGKADGWRFANMPPDPQAYAHALNALATFDTLSRTEQQELLTRLAAGKVDGAALSAEQMQQWFEDLRADLVRLWTAHPATMARIGFDGFANGGDGLRKQGFHLLGVGEREGWEPLVEVPR